MKNIIDAIIINGVKYNRVEATISFQDCDECDLEKICSINLDFGCMCAYASECGYVWKTDKKI